MTNQTITHTLTIGDHVAYWHNGEPRAGVIHNFTRNRQSIFIYDDWDKEIHQVSAHLVTYQPLDQAA